VRCLFGERDHLGRIRGLNPPGKVQLHPGVAHEGCGFSNTGVFRILDLWSPRPGNSGPTSESHVDPAAHSPGRIVPEAPPQPDPTLESGAVWGFADSGFSFTESGDLTFLGDRYPLSGQLLDRFLPWARRVIGFPLDPSDRLESRYPTPIPERRVHDAFEQALAAWFAGDQVRHDHAARLRHGHGHTLEDMWLIKHGSMERAPDLVVHPESEAQVQALVDLARTHDACLIPYGGGTNVTNALRCPSDEHRPIVSVDMRRMNRVLWIDPENQMACVEAGATGREIAEQLAAYGFTMGHEPDSYEFSTLGGWVATNASGMKKNRYGNIEDLVLGITAITASGRLERASAPPRESIGGDPARWLIGSEGRLGIVTSATVKIFPLPELQRHGSVIFRDFEAGLAFLRDVQLSGAKPASIRLMDNLQFQFGQALKARKEGARALRSRIEEYFVTRVLSFDPDAMVACTLLFEGSLAEVEAQEKIVYRLAKKHQGMKGGAENGERGYALTFSIAYIRDFLLEHHVVAESFETSIPWTGVVPMVERVKRRVRAEHASRGLPGAPFVSARVTQLYETGVAVYFYFGCYMKGVENASEVFGELEHAARCEILDAGGSLSHHHGVGKLRSSFLPEVLSETALDWRLEMKRAVDPENLFCCGN